MTWPSYTLACRRDVNELLKQGGTLSKYRANKGFGLGPKKGSWAERLEREIEKRFNVKHAVVCNSGTSALYMALAGLDLPKGSEIITSPYTFSATPAAILQAGYTPVFADIDPYSYCITKETVKHVLSRKTKAILPVHLFGRCDDIHDLMELGLPIVEDSCQSVGARSRGIYAGTFGVVGAFSFNGTKNLPCGEGGCLVTDNSKIADRARLILNHAENYDKPWIGWNFRMTELEACVAYHGLVELEERNKERIHLSAVLWKELDWLCEKEHPKLCRFAEDLELEDDLDGSHVYYTYAFQLKRRNRSRYIVRLNKLLGHSWASGGYITPPLHHYSAFRRYSKFELPIVDDLSFKKLCLLSCVTPGRSRKDMQTVAKCMMGAFA